MTTMAMRVQGVVKYGETFREFCARYGATPCAVMAANPVLRGQQRHEGVELFIGQVLAVPMSFGGGLARASAFATMGSLDDRPDFGDHDSGTFREIDKGEYLKAQSCIEQGGVPEEGDCWTVVERDGKVFAKAPSGEEIKLDAIEVARYKNEFPYAAACVKANGVVSEGVCYKTGDKVLPDGTKVFGALLDEPLKIDVPKAGEEEKKSSYVPWLLGGLGVAAAVGLIYAASRSGEASRAANPHGGWGRAENPVSYDEETRKIAQTIWALATPRDVNQKIFYTPEEWRRKEGPTAGSARTRALRPANQSTPPKTEHLGETEHSWGCPDPASLWRTAPGPANPKRPFWRHPGSMETPYYGISIGTF